jgi:hypothetical protein
MKVVFPANASRAIGPISSRGSAQTSLKVYRSRALSPKISRKASLYNVVNSGPHTSALGNVEHSIIGSVVLQHASDLWKSAHRSWRCRQSRRLRLVFGDLSADSYRIGHWLWMVRRRWMPS